MYFLLIIQIQGGEGNISYSGDGSLAVNCTLSYVYGIGGNTQGDVYLSDSANGRIRKVGIDGVINTVAGEYFNLYICGTC
jgi:hypothetical protein